MILRRINTPEEPKTAWVNDRRASGELLRALSDRGGTATASKTNRGARPEAAPRDARCTSAGTGRFMAEVRAAWASRRAAAKALETAEARLAEMRAEEDYLAPCGGGS